MSAVLPFSQVSTAALRDYLLSQGLSRPIVEWKYFDPYLKTQRERGHVLVQDGQIAGFLGLIPFPVEQASQQVEAAWSCDWFRDPGAPGLLALALIKESLRGYDAIYSLGGSKNTAAILPRLARRTVTNAAVTLHKPLRLSVLSTLAAKKAGMRFLRYLSPLLNVRLPGSTNRPHSPKVLIRNGVAADLTSVLAESSGPSQSTNTHYGLEYLEWQLGRCPDTVPFTCIVRADTGSQAAILFWRHFETLEFWRLAILGSTRITNEELQAGLDAVIDCIVSLGGSLLSVLISTSQANLLQTLRRRGFLASRRYLPLYILSRDPTDQYGELAELSYLDSDLGYRFSLVTGD